jgi:predicted aldo/keto reductase-like oxidoreductase
MQYRNFGKLDWQVSALGFGCMRLPTINNEMAKINEPEAIKMIRYAIDKGVNYVDTAYMYHMGNSEKVVGKALKDGYRAKVRLATKLPAMMIQSADQFDKIFNEQLERLQTKKVDFYLMHGLNKASWEKIRDMKVLKWAEGRMKKGQIGNIGFSFHDEYKVFKKIVDAYDNWTFCQIQYNYVDVKNQAGRKGVEYAANKGLALVVMEPIRGGLLAKNPPKAVAKVWGKASQTRSYAEWALQWVWNQPEISVALSGMSTMEQVVANVAAAGRSGPKTLTTKELTLIKKVTEAYKSLSPVPCTGCRYCQPCPNGVDIPGVFQLYNEVTMYEAPELGYFRYASPMGIKPENRADNCVECGKCVEVCPQKIEIPEWLQKAHAQMTPPKGKAFH